MSEQAPGTLPSFNAVLRHALGDALDPDAGDLMAMCAPGVVFEFPFAPPGMPKRVEGRDALADYLTGLGEMLTLDRMTVPVVYPVREDGVFVLEFGSEATSRINGRTLKPRYIAVVRVEGGKIVLYRDYWDPTLVSQATEAGGEANG